MKSKEALEKITDWIEYFTRLDYVDPIVRGEVQKNFYDAYHKTRPELELIKKDLEILEILRENTPNLHYILGSNNYEEYKIICDKHDAETDVDEKDYEKIKEWVGGIFD